MMPVPGLSTKADFEKMFEPGTLKRSGDKWGHGWRGSQRYRLCRNVMLIQEHVRLSRSLKILDIGCGQADLLNRLRQINPGLLLSGSDISDNAIQWNKNRFKDIDFRQCTLPEIGHSPDSFDLITAFEVIYYLSYPDQERAIGNMAATLKSGGFLVLSGGLDNGSRYFNQEKIQLLVAQHLEIKQALYVYGGIYNQLERTLLRVLEYQEYFDSISNCSQEFFLEKISSKPLYKRSITLILRHKYINTWVSGLFSVIQIFIRYILGFEWLPRICNYLTRAFMGARGRTRIILVAQKR